MGHGLCSKCYYLANKARINACSRQTYKNNTDKYKTMVWANKLKRTFNMTADDYNDLLLLQDNKCAICGRKPKRFRFAVDHNHQNGKVRGLLCVTCNTKLGWIEKYKNNVDLYLERSR